MSTTQFSGTILDELKRQTRAIGSKYTDRELRARRLFIEERATPPIFAKDIQFSIKSEISKYFGINHSSVHFCGSAQLGFSIHKNRLFEPAVSDLDASCVSNELFQKAWVDVINSTQAFNNLTAFGTRKQKSIELFKE